MRPGIVQLWPQPSSDAAADFHAAAAQLRRNVTSPGGTTEAALDVLLGDGGMGELMRRATQAAADRAQELAQPKDGQTD